MKIAALVTRCVGNRCQVMDREGRLYEAMIKGNLRIKGIRSTNPIVVGDSVLLSINDGSNAAQGSEDFPAVIESIAPRHNYIIRKSINLSKESHILAANIDLAYLLVTLVPPATSFTFVDRFLATAEAYNIKTQLLFNKIDLYGGDYLADLCYWEALYQGIGYTTHRISATKGIGITTLLDESKGKIVLLSGHSGVGKSSLINSMIPGSNLATASLSEAHQTGMHTTTVAELIPLGKTPAEGFLIDTPGIKGFGTLEMDASNAWHYFPEIFQISQACRFHNCTHRGEPGCAVVAAVHDQRIAPSRYQSYLSILQDAESGKYRPPQ